MALDSRALLLEIPVISARLAPTLHYRQVRLVIVSRILAVIVVAVAVAVAIAVVAAVVVIGGG